MKLTKIIGLLLATLLAVGGLVSCAESGYPNNEADDMAVTYISLRINPEIEMLSDKDGKIISANAVNEDGEVVLSMIELEGMSAEEVGIAFTDTAIELGYLDPEGENPTVYVCIEGDENTENNEIKEKLTKNIGDYFKNKGINGKVSPETLDKYAEKAEEWGVSAGHTKLIMRALDAHPELTDSEVLEMSVKEILELIKGGEKEEKIAEGLKDDFHSDVEKLKQEYSRLFDLRSEVKQLESELENQTGYTDEEIENIKADIAEKKGEIEILQSEYKEKTDEIKSTYKDASKEARDEYRKEAEERKNNKKDKPSKGNANDEPESIAE